MEVCGTGARTEIGLLCWSGGKTRTGTGTSRMYLMCLLIVPTTCGSHCNDCMPHLSLATL